MHVHDFPHESLLEEDFSKVFYPMHASLSVAEYHWRDGGRTVDHVHRDPTKREADLTL